jgi:hypothetical protein
MHVQVYFRKHAVFVCMCWWFVLLSGHSMIRYKGVQTGRLHKYGYICYTCTILKISYITGMYMVSYWSGIAINVVITFIILFFQYRGCPGHNRRGFDPYITAPAHHPSLPQHLQRV